MHGTWVITGTDPVLWRQCGLPAATGHSRRRCLSQCPCIGCHRVLIRFPLKCELFLPVDLYHSFMDPASIEHLQYVPRRANYGVRGGWRGSHPPPYWQRQKEFRQRGLSGRNTVLTVWMTAVCSAVARGSQRKSLQWPVLQAWPCPGSGWSAQQSRITPTESRTPAFPTVTCAHGSGLLACGSVQPSGVSFYLESLRSPGVLSSPHAWLLELRSLAAARMNGPSELRASPLPSGPGDSEEAWVLTATPQAPAGDTGVFRGPLCGLDLTAHLPLSALGDAFPRVGLLASPHLSEEWELTHGSQVR